MAGARFEVAKLSHVKQQIVDLAARAANAGIKQRFLSLFRATLRHLERRPWEVGDPLYPAHHPDGVIYRVARSPFIIDFALFEQDKLVLIFNVFPHPHAFPK